MSASAECRHIRELSPELALGIVTGEERARALEHVGACPGCRQLLAELSEVADGLVALAPAQEPPVGFESRVIERLGRPRRPRWQRAVAGLAAAALVAALGAGAVLQVTERERTLGAAYAETLRIADGEYLSAAVLRAPDGTRAGLVFGYEGSPSWVFVTVSDAPRSGRYDVFLDRPSGSERVGTIDLREGGGSWGASLHGEFHGAEGVVLRSGPHRLHARF